jgi:opacity protein-like surface antigen
MPVHYFAPTTDSTDRLSPCDEEEYMRALLKGVTALALTSLLAAPALRAQGAEFSLGGGLGVPLGNFDDAVKLGWMGLFGVSFVPNGSPVGIQFDGQYQQYKFDGSTSLKDRLLVGTGNIVFKFKTSDESTFRPYLIGGGGVYNIKATGTNDLGPLFDTGGSTTKFGLNAGAGFDFKAGSAGLFVEGRFHDVFTSGSNVKFLPITVGIRFGGS